MFVTQNGELPLKLMKQKKPAYEPAFYFIMNSNYSFSIAENASNKTFHLWFLSNSQMRT